MKKLEIIQPNYNSKLVETLFALQGLRSRALGGSTPPWIFYDLKEIIHLVESFASAKIENNKTTLIQAALDKVEKKSDSEALQEIRNIQEAIIFTEKYIKSGGKIDEAFVREIHKKITDNMRQSNGNTPGLFRKIDVKISETNVETANPLQVPELMCELVEFINEKTEDKDIILKIAIAHHRFTVIHPFADGNGRTARMLTYAMLLEKGFIEGGQFGELNPMSIFGADRYLYFKKLGRADTETKAGIEEWCLFVAEGLKKEIEKMFQLFDKKYIVKNFILPTVEEYRKAKIVSENEADVLKIAIEKDIFQRADIAHLFGSTASGKTRASRLIASMVRKGLIMPLPKNPHKYVMRFSNNLLLPKILELMDEEGFLPVVNSGK